MQSKDLYPKAIAVYEAVLTLMHHGKDITTLTVADIARAAGIGKGTTYDYFSSKEEIIAKSLIYGYKMLLEKIIRSMAEEKTLETKIRSLLATAAKYENTGSMFEKVMMMVSSSKEMQVYIKSIFEEEQINISYFTKVVDDFIQCAVKEGILPDIYDQKYVPYVFLSLLQTIFGPMNCVLNRLNMADQEMQVQYLYKMTVAALKSK